MLQKLDIHQPERTVDLPCDSHITAGRQCDAARMVVSQHHARRPAFECFGDHFRHGNRRGVGAALGDEHATQQHAAVIHSRHIKSFLRAGEEFRHEKCAGFFYACKRHFVGRLVLQIICAHLRDKFEHDGAGMPHAGHTLQFFDGRVQHSRKAAEPVDQRMRQRIRIAPGARKKEQKLHGVMLLKPGQSLPQETLVYTPAVVVMYAQSSSSFTNG